MSHSHPDAPMLYLALVQRLAIRALDISRRLFFAVLALASLLIALSVGAVDAGGRFSVIGLDVTHRLWVPLTVLSVLGLVFLSIEIAHYERGHRLAWRAVHLYRELGYTVPQREWHSGGSPFSLPYAALLTPDRPWGRWLSYRVAALIGTTIVALMVVVGQVLAAVRVRADVGWTLPVCLLVLVPVVTCVVAALRAIKLLRSNGHQTRPWS